MGLGDAYLMQGDWMVLGHSLMPLNGYVNALG